MTSTTNPISPLWVAVTLALAVVISAFGLAARYRVEEANKAVTILAELDQIEALAAPQGLDVKAALLQLEAQGLGGVVLSEESVAELVDEGRLRLDSAGSGLTISGNRADLDRVVAAAESFLGLNVSPIPNGEARLEVLLRGVPAGVIRSLPLGVDAERAGVAKGLGLTVVGRLGNPLGASEAYVRSSIRRLAEAGATVFLPLGDQVLGRRDHLAALLEALAQTEMLYASPEFTRLSGDANVLAKMPEQVVRLHAAQSAELDRMTAAAVVDRYTRAARERNIRLLLLRPVGFASDQPLSTFGSLVREVTRGVLKEGAGVGVARPFPSPTGSLPAILYALPVGLAVGLVLRAILGEARLTASLLAGGVLTVPLFALESLNGYGALLAALAFPTLGFVLLSDADRRSPTRLFLLMTACSLAGGLVVAGVLSGLPYLIRADQFPGVKLAHFGPILVVGVVLFLRLGQGRQALASPITWTQAGLGILILGALLFMLTRTGNDNPAGVSETELRLRALLDTLLMVRPRTKEFLIGHPALIIGLGLLSRLPRGSGSDMGGWAALALTLGAIGQTSIVNTLCHFHTPLSIGISRIFVGGVLGGILGLILWAIVRRYVPMREA